VNIPQFGAWDWLVARWAQWGISALFGALGGALMYVLQFKKLRLEIAKLTEERAGEKKLEALCDRIIVAARMRQTPLALFTEGELCDLLGEPVSETMKALLCLQRHGMANKSGPGYWTIKS
jgi:hypothetical protein